MFWERRLILIYLFFISNKNILLKEEKVSPIQGVYIRDKAQIKSIKYKNPKAHEQKINHGLK